MLSLQKHNHWTNNNCTNNTQTYPDTSLQAHVNTQAEWHNEASTTCQQNGLQQMTASTNSHKVNE